MTLAAGVAATGAATAGIVADAAVPAFPDNIVVFPDRDFVTIEGYQNHVGETALVEVSRDGQVVGSAKGVVEAGDVAFEINHPGGYCWGNGTSLQVTPDIRPGDKVSISFNGIDGGDTTVQNSFVTARSSVSGSTLTVKGYAGPGVNQAQMEQRIINPDLVDTEIGRRDIRAVPGPLTPAPKGGYSSSLEFEGNIFTATYVFTDAANATIAGEATGERAMAWQNEDADGNRQGLTIAEFGEAGGPGMGGCPAGPGDAATPQPGSAIAQRSTDKSSLSVTWTPADPIPGAAAITGYSVEAIKQDPNSLGEKEIVGKRTSTSATHVNLTGLSTTAGYDVEVRSMAGDKMSASFSVAVPSPDTLGDATAPTLTVSPANTAAINTISEPITLSSETGADIYYTLDGTPAVDGGLPSDTAKHYTEPIVITGQVTLHAVVFDRAGNFDTFTGVYKAAADGVPVPSAVTAISGTAGQASVTLSWAAPEVNVTGYGIQAYAVNTAGDHVATGTLKETTARTYTYTGLTAGTTYYFTIKAKNVSGYGPESTEQGPFVPTKVTDTVTIGTARWKTGDFRVTGSGSAVGALLEVRNATSTGPGTTVLMRGQVEPPVAPATVGTYDIRARNTAAPATNPGKIYVVSENGGQAGPFVVANG